MTTRAQTVTSVLRDEYNLDGDAIAEWMQTSGSTVEDIDRPITTDTLPGLDAIIDFLGGTDPATWWAGPTFRSPDQTQHCVLSHVFERWGAEGMNEFEERYSTCFVIGGAVNDRVSEKYPQPHPRERVIAYLRAMQRGAELTVYESLDATCLASTPERGAA
jgi:hypothetical protein